MFTEKCEILAIAINSQNLLVCVRCVFVSLVFEDQVWESVHLSVFIIYKSRYILDISKAQSR